MSLEGEKLKLPSPWLIHVTRHAVERYIQWRTLRRDQPLTGLPVDEELKLMLATGEVCTCDMPAEILRERYYNNGAVPVHYVRSGPYRLVYSSESRVLFTVEPDIYPDDPRLWAHLTDVVRNFYKLKPEKVMDMLRLVDQGGQSNAG